MISQLLQPTVIPLILNADYTLLDGSILHVFGEHDVQNQIDTTAYIQVPIFELVLGMSEIKANSQELSINYQLRTYPTQMWDPLETYARVVLNTGSKRFRLPPGIKLLHKK